MNEIYDKVVGKLLQEKLVNLGLTDKMKFTHDKLRVDASIIKEWFAAPVKELISHLKAILAEQKMRDVKTILLVGGFSENLLVQDEMRKNMKSQRIIIPDEAGLVVLKGAFRFGHYPDIVSSRIMSFTYGMSVYVPFDQSKHPVSKMVIINDNKKCDDVFRIFVRSGDEIKVGQEIYKANFVPTTPEQTEVIIYRSTNREPKYVTDEGCKRLGAMIIDHPHDNTFEDKRFTITFVFGDTELFVKAKIIKTRREFTTYIDCLE